ncbi:hypothetical protein GXW74_21260 [Roseomonas eburnea]|uniref:Uncharacterized protein n=1 Tax=Neoroseomonas eburnea TaxID=1346889 RepID=A0A9X9XH49_9PROT|nr:hypothetical protein [Neoroseomonas eburnea]MBR0683035.1 hypothetical protein [Neoroseomonas eburnea]
MPDLPQAVVVSAVAGRMRLRLPAHRDDAAFFARLAQRALMLPGVTGAAGTPLTAGLLLRFRGDAETVLAAAAREGLFRAAQPVPDQGHAASAAQLAPLGAAAFGLLALLQAARGAVLPPAATLLWYAGSLLRGATQPTPEE